MGRMSLFAARKAPETRADRKRDFPARAATYPRPCRHRLLSSHRNDQNLPNSAAQRAPDLSRFAGVE